MAKANKSELERCPWYVFVCRIFMILGIVFLLYMFALTLLTLILQRFEETLCWWTWAVTTIQSYPVAAIVLLVAGYLVLLLWFVSLMAKRLTQALFGTV